MTLRYYSLVAIQAVRQGRLPFGLAKRPDELDENAPVV